MALNPVKVRSVSGHRRIGIAAKSVDDLRRKSAAKFQLKEKECFSLVLEGDGTEVDEDEYLELLAPHTVLVLVRENETWRGVTEQLEVVLQRVLSISGLAQVGERIEEMVREEKSPLMSFLLTRAGDNLSMNITAESRTDDPAWFQDVPPKFKTKTEYLKEKARHRVRGYLYHTKDHIKNAKLKPSPKHSLEDVTDYFFKRLKKEDYYGDYFARKTEREDVRFCDEEGWFKCEGVFSMNHCHHSHLINPYGTRENLRLLSTWDLDHRIEKSRTVLPCMEKAASRTEKRINRDYFFELIFTRRNLKLVHPVCHDKSRHTTEQCDPNLIYVKNNNIKRDN